MAETADDGSDTGQSADITLVPSLAVQIINQTKKKTTNINLNVCNVNFREAIKKKSSFLTSIASLVFQIQ